jgi:hypothetical protein
MKSVNHRFQRVAPGIGSHRHQENLLPSQFRLANLPVVQIAMG